MTDFANQNPISASCTYVAAGDASPSVSADIDLSVSQSPASLLISEITRARTASDSLEVLIRACKELICRFNRPTGLWLAQRDESGKFDHQFSLLGETGKTVEPEQSRYFRKLTKLALQHRKIQTVQRNNCKLIVSPVADGDQISALLVGCFPEPAELDVEMTLGAVGQAISCWLAERRCARSEVRMKSLNDFVLLGKQLNQCASLNSAAIILVNQLKQMMSASQVVFAVETTTGLPEILAISDLDEIDASSDGLKTMRVACTQSLQSNEVLRYPVAGQCDHSGINALEQYCRKLGQEACLAMPLNHSSMDRSGCLLIATSQAKLAQPSYVEYLTELSELLAGHLAVVMQANRTWVDHSLHSMNQHLKSDRTKFFAAVLLSCLAFMLVPWPYLVHCDCEVQPVLRRFVSAPHDGILQKNLVQKGDMVKAGQPVALLDDRFLRIELAGLEAQLAGVTKQRSAATARGSIAEAQIAEAEMRKLNSEIQFVTRKLENLEVTSPIAGIIVTGDLDKVEGAPVEMGQRLFEIGPLEQMLVEVAVPEEEIAHVKNGMPVRFKLDAYPYESWAGNIIRIHPKSELRDAASVFIAEVEIPNSESKLKPGMKGSVQVVSGNYPIGWNLFHRPFENLRYWTIW